MNAADHNTQQTRKLKGHPEERIPPPRPNVQTAQLILDCSTLYPNFILFRQILRPSLHGAHVSPHLSLYMPQYEAGSARKLFLRIPAAQCARVVKEAEAFSHHCVLCQPRTAV